VSKSSKYSSKKAALAKIRFKQTKDISSTELTERVINGEKSALSEAITLLESTNPTHKKISSEIIQACLPHSGKSFRVGITGVPGVGKSTFIESFGNLLLKKEHKVAVLAIDPSSQKTKGSILGDKTRMQTLISEENVFIRPSPTSQSLGGVARATKESILLCEAAGFDFIIIETVGVGQSETEVHSMVDYFLLLMLSGAGDELQGIKRGIMEMADALVITKADGDNEKPAKRAMIEYKRAVHLLPPAEHLFPVNVNTCSALTGSGLNEIYSAMDEYKLHTKESGFFHDHRKTQNVAWLKRHLRFSLVDRFYRDNAKTSFLSELEKKVKNEEISPFKAVELLLE